MSLEEEKRMDVEEVEGREVNPAGDSLLLGTSDEKAISNDLTKTETKPETATKECAKVDTQVTDAAVVAENSNVALQTTMKKVSQSTRVYNYGSCEMDQFWLPGQRSETRRPYLNSFMESFSVAKIACGSLHTLILTSQGLLFSSGINDDGALGRLDENDLDDESDKKSKLVQLPVRVDMISAGASHSVAANSALGVCFQWGAYRNTEKSNLAPPTRTPVRVGVKEFEKKTFAKVLSGSQHSLVLTTEGELFAWGDPDMGVIGRVPRTRHGYEQALKVARITQHKVSEVFTADRHCFLRRTVPTTKQTSWYSWGLNNFGQLGLDVPEEEAPSVVFEPTKLTFFEGMDVVEFTGGESHSLAYLSDGTLYGFGRNDIGQFGLGEVNSDHPVHGKIKEINHKPLKIDSLPESAKQIDRVWSGPNYVYAKDITGQCFSWGFGANFVLGNRKDENEDELKPFAIPRDFFKNEEIPTEFSLGSQHVSYLVVDGEDKTVAIEKEILLNAPVEFLPQHLRPSITALSKEVKAAKAAEREATAKEREEKVKEKAQESQKKQKESELAKQTKLREEQARKLTVKAQKLELLAKQIEAKARKMSEEVKNGTEDKNETEKKGENNENRGRSKSATSKKQPSKLAGKSKSASSRKQVSVSRERSVAAKKPETKGKGVSSNKKKITNLESIKVFQSKSTKQIRQEPVTFKKR